jgi:hypothetical protein
MIHRAAVSMADRTRSGLRAVLPLRFGSCGWCRSVRGSSGGQSQCIELSQPRFDVVPTRDNAAHPARVSKAVNSLRRTVAEKLTHS